MFSKRLKESRVLRGYTQEEIANKLDITLNAYQKYEQGTRSPSLDTLVKIADFYDVSIDWLLGRDLWIDTHEESSDECL